MFLQFLHQVRMEPQQLEWFSVIPHCFGWATILVDNCKFQSSNNIHDMVIESTDLQCSVCWVVAFVTNKPHWFDDISNLFSHIVRLKGNWVSGFKLVRVRKHSSKAWWRKSTLLASCSSKEVQVALSRVKVVVKVESSKALKQLRRRSSKVEKVLMMGGKASLKGWSVKDAVKQRKSQVEGAEKWSKRWGNSQIVKGAEDGCIVMKLSKNQ